MVTFGGDSHSHTLVAVDENGRQLGERTVAATPSGHMEVLGWARQWPERRWALENCRHLSRVFERELLSAGEAVLQVSPKLMGMARRTGRELRKSDPIDALAVARAALREPHLPVARLEGKDREVKLLVDHHEDLVGERRPRTSVGSARAQLLPCTTARLRFRSGLGIRNVTASTAAATVS